MNGDMMIKIMLNIVDEQIRKNDPPITKKTLNRLLALGHSEDIAKKMIAICVSKTMNTTLQTELPFDKEQFTRLLNRLPEFKTPGE